MRIPESFQIFGQTVTVAWDANLSARHTAAGMFLPVELRIELQPSTTGTARSRTYIEQSFLHELIHCILSLINEKELEMNEKFVDLFAHALHQALTTQDGELV